ncbi:MAG: hypothetical protein HY744_13325 [Deltaproteobacteria bacterium]|nr:hypothetical protein [Deltaproteobacteria bacterium]
MKRPAPTPPTARHANAVKLDAHAAAALRLLDEAKAIAYELAGWPHTPAERQRRLQRSDPSGRELAAAFEAGVVREAAERANLGGAARRAIQVLHGVSRDSRPNKIAFLAACVEQAVREHDELPADWREGMEDQERSEARWAQRRWLQVFGPTDAPLELWRAAVRARRNKRGKEAEVRYVDTVCALAVALGLRPPDDPQGTDAETVRRYVRARRRGMRP